MGQAAEDAAIKIRFQGVQTMTNTNSKFTQTFTAVICTVLFSTTCVLSAVGPARAAEGNQTVSPVVRPLA